LKDHFHRQLPAQFDVITTFDVVHDAVDPLQLLQSIRRALRPGGVYVCLDINCSDKLEENANPLGAMFHGVSVFYCMTTSLAKMARGWARSASMKRKCASCARKPASAAYDASRWIIRSTIYTKRNRREHRYGGFS
jgi:2-polyprenyl-3-methyl-5-hydroxy-6-metoxy-1,4-benzoquinol methylase